MKKIILSLLFISSISFAQTGINYQGAATDADGAKLVNQNISLKTSVLQGGVDGVTSYSETHNTTTDQFGLFNVVIGQGVSISGDFETISWGSDDHFLKVELDATGGTNYNLVSTTQMMSVPYALYAKNAGLDSAAVADMLASMNFSANSSGCNYLFPEGLSGQPITEEISNSIEYTVPNGKRLYITQIGDIVPIIDNFSFGYDDFISRGKPIILNSGQTLKHNDSQSYFFNGILVNENSKLTAITQSVGSGGGSIEPAEFIVPENKVLFVLNFNAIPIINGNYLSYYYTKNNPYHNIAPLILKSGQSFSSNSDQVFFNGYLVDEDFFADCGGGGGSSTSTPSSVDSAMVADMIAANTSSGLGGDWELLYDELNTNNDEPYGTVNRYGIAQSDGFLYLVGSYATVYTGNDHDTITNTWPENPILQNISANDPNEAHIIPLKKNMSWHIEFHSTLGYITKGYFIPNGGGSASLANGGMSGTSKSFIYPEGINNNFITLSIKNSNTYIVPENKNLYITNAYSSWGSPQLLIDNKIISKGDINYMGTRFGNPIIVGSGSIIDLSSESGTEYDILEITIQGFLTNSSVTPITFSLDEESYTVPSNKTLFIASYFSSSGSPILNINEKTISRGDFNYNSYRGFINPIVATENEIVSTDSEYDFTINGYLADLDYFESPSASSASNSGGGGNTMDISVSLFGDTLYGFGNDFLIIPGISTANLHMHVNEFGSITDIDGNTYKTLVYGDDEWMIENLKTEIGSYVTPFNQNTTYIQPDSIGYYYSTSDLENVCPTGWHVATIEDWQNLHYTIFGNQMNPNGYTSSNEGFDVDGYRMLWSQHLNANTPGTNLTFFNLFRTGWWLNSANQISSEGLAKFWTTDGCNAGIYMVNFDENGFTLDVGCTSASNVKGQVRCVKD